MIGKCMRCKKRRYIYNPGQKIKLCSSCYQMKTRDVKKVKENTKRWQEKNREKYNEYMRNYMRKRASEKSAKEKSK